MCIVMWLVGSTAGCVNKCSQVSNFLIGTRKTALHSVLSRIYALSSVKFLPQIVLSTARSRLSQVRTFAFGGESFSSARLFIIICLVGRLVTRTKSWVATRLQKKHTAFVNNHPPTTGLEQKDKTNQATESNNKQQELL